MIRLHRLGHRDAAFDLNPDLIMTVESTPDTVVTLLTHSKMVVRETPDEVAEAVRSWRASILGTATRGARRGGASLVVLRGTAGDASAAAAAQRAEEGERRP